MDSFDIFKQLSRGAHFKRKSGSRAKEQCEPIQSQTHEDAAHKVKRPKMEIKDESCNKIVLSNEIISEPCLNNPKIKKVSQNTMEEKEIKFQDKTIGNLRNVNIEVKGKNVPSLVEKFEDMNKEINISSKIIKNMFDFGYSKPTPIQMQAIPIMAMGRQILAYAPTGSGKTAAFLVPVLSQLDKPSKSGVRALILCPTHELVRQIYRECLGLSRGTGLKVHMMGKVSVTSNFGSNFSKKFDILLSTPNRLVYLLRREDSPLILKNLKWLIIDECDKLFETGITGFGNQIIEIYKSCDLENLNRALFSATHVRCLEAWCKKNINDLIIVSADIRNTAVKNVKQELVYVGKEYGKLIAFRNLIQQGLSTPALVFVQSKERAKELFEEFILDGIYVDVIHSDRPQLQRDNVIKAFRTGKIWVLICTELLGRGIDFKGVKLVLNYDFPQSVVSYIHRIGRTGRAGMPGRAITFFTNEDRPLLKSIARVVNKSGNSVPEYMLTLKQKNKFERQIYESMPVKRETIAVSLNN